MKCPYCGNQMQDTDKFCSFCGSKTFNDTFNDTKKTYDTTNETRTNAIYTTEGEVKKNNSPLKIILIVFLCSAIFSSAFFIGVYAIFKSVDINFSDFIDFTDDEDDADYKDFDDYKYSNTFEPGITNASDKTYINESLGLEFQLPDSWHVYNMEEMDDLYKEYDISNELKNNNLYLYDFYAEDENSGASLYVDFFNADYYLGSESLKAFNDSIKSDTEEYAKQDNYEVQIADDSTMNFQGGIYDQLAAKYVGADGTIIYQYDFTRYVDGYFAKITVFSSDLETIGNIINILGSNK